MSWSSDFRSIILRGRNFFFFKYLKKRFVVWSRQCLIEGLFFLQIFFYATLYVANAHVPRFFFSQLVSKLRLMGLPWTSVFYYSTSLSLFQTDSQKLAGASSLKSLTSVIWTLQSTSSVLSRLYSRASLNDTFHYRQVVGCKTNLDWSAGIF